MNSKTDKHHSYTICDIMGTKFFAKFPNNDAGTLLENLFWTLNFKYFASKSWRGYSLKWGVYLIKSLNW